MTKNNVHWPRILAACKSPWSTFHWNDGLIASCWRTDCFLWMSNQGITARTCLVRSQWDGNIGTPRRWVTGSCVSLDREWLRNQWGCPEKPRPAGGEQCCYSGTRSCINQTWENGLQGWWQMTLNSPMVLFVGSNARKKRKKKPVLMLLDQDKAYLIVLLQQNVDCAWGVRWGTLQSQHLRYICIDY